MKFNYMVRCIIKVLDQLPSTNIRFPIYEVIKLLTNYLGLQNRFDFKFWVINKLIVGGGRI